MTPEDWSPLRDLGFDDEACLEVAHVVGVFNHPYHTVSKQGGTWELKLPAGNYEVVAWHEKYGVQTQMVEVKDNDKKEVTFGFKADSKPTE